MGPRVSPGTFVSWLRCQSVAVGGQRADDVLTEESAEDLASPTPDPETVKLVYEEMLGRVALQDAQISTLDGKANFGLGSATVVAAVLALVQDAAGRGVADGSWSWWLVRGSAALALAVYAWTVWTAFNAYQIRSFDASPNAMTLMRTVALTPPDEARGSLSWERACNLAHNAPRIDEKACWARRAILGLLAEAILLALIAVVQVLALVGGKT